MIYNLSKYISNNSSIIPVTNGRDPNITGDQVFLIETGGGDSSRGLKVDTTVQIIGRSDDRVYARSLTLDVFDLLNNRFDITLPAVTVNSKGGSVVHPAVKVAQMIPLQRPGYIGTDNNGLHEYSVNFQITTQED